MSDPFAKKTVRCLVVDPLVGTLMVVHLDPIPSDLTDLIQRVEYLVTNAVKFSKPEQTVIIQDGITTAGTAGELGSVFSVALHSPTVRITL